jgi:hypothetical protein
MTTTTSSSIRRESELLGQTVGVIGGSFSPQVTKSWDGKLWFTGLDGASAVDPLHLPFNGVPPPVQIEQIVADHTTYRANVAVKLPRLARDLEIDYTAEDRACQTDP